MASARKLLRSRNCIAVLLAASYPVGCSTGLSVAADNRHLVQQSAAGQQANDPAAEQRETAKSPRYTYRKIHDPNGIGKFYMGREIARVMGFGGINWLERSKREQEEKLSLLIRALKLKPGMVVADIGAGSGVVSVLLAEGVGPKGKVIGVDIQKEMLHALRKKLDQRKITNVELVQGTLKSARLPPASVDLAIMVDVYHEFSFPYEMMQGISKALKPGGRVAFVEYRKEDPNVRRLIKLVHTMTEAQVKKEIGQAEFGLKWKETIGVLPRQAVIVFERQVTVKKATDKLDLRRQRQ